MQRVVWSREHREQNRTEQNNTEENVTERNEREKKIKILPLARAENVNGLFELANL